jgi:hypothetical protein
MTPSSSRGTVTKAALRLAQPGTTHSRDSVAFSGVGVAFGRTEDRPPILLATCLPRTREPAP